MKMSRIPTQACRASATVVSMTSTWLQRGANNAFQPAKSVGQAARKWIISPGKATASTKAVARCTSQAPVPLCDPAADFTQTASRRRTA
jgi:hypothetical protein